MASTKISGLGALTGANVSQTADFLPIVDTSVTQTKKILISELSLAQNINGTEQATTSGKSVSFSIPAWVTRITMMLVGVSIDATSSMHLNMEPSSSYKTSIINAAGTISTSSATYFVTPSGAQTAAMVMEGSIIMTRENSASTTWMINSCLSTSNAATDVYRGVGRVVLTGALTSISLNAGVAILAPANFDAGAVNVLYS